MHARTYSCEELRILAGGAHVDCVLASGPMVPLHSLMRPAAALASFHTLGRLLIRRRPMNSVGIGCRLRQPSRDGRWGAGCVRQGPAWFW